MKKVLFCWLFCLALSLAYAQNAEPFSGIAISFTFNRQSGTSSNQFAVWIEDSRGDFVTTLFATRYTATGGWQRRPLSIPLWVRQSGLSAMNRGDIDAFSGATPRTGAVSYHWDGRDKGGNLLASGGYRILLEATLRRENRVLYSAPFIMGSTSSAATDVDPEVTIEYFGSDTRERGMIERVRVTYLP